MLFHRTKDVADARGLLAVRKGRLDTAYIRETLSGILPESDDRFGEIADLLR
ncbi:MAG: hypothetical protein V1809_06145 [Planctomycetota bacterium]